MMERRATGHIEQELAKESFGEMQLSWAQPVAVVSFDPFSQAEDLDLRIEGAFASGRGFISALTTTAGRCGGELDGLTLRLPDGSCREYVVKSAAGYKDIGWPPEAVFEVDPLTRHPLPLGVFAPDEFQAERHSLEPLLTRKDAEELSPERYVQIPFADFRSELNPPV